MLLGSLHSTKPGRINPIEEKWFSSLKSSNKIKIRNNQANKLLLYFTFDGKLSMILGILENLLFIDPELKTSDARYLLENL